MKFEASRIANAAFLLVGRGMRTHRSILDQLEIQEKHTFIASNGDQTNGSPLVVVELQKVKKDDWVLYAEPSGFHLRQSKRMEFNEWWFQRIHTGRDGRELDRNSLVRLFRDKDGGSPLDEEVTDERMRELLNGDIGLYYESNGVKGMVPWAVHTMVRQIGAELLNSIQFLETTYDAPTLEYQWLEGSRFE